MQIINASYEILTHIEPVSVLKFIEKIGRTAYQSENKITEDSCRQFVKMIVSKKHLSILEHYSFSVKFICSRGIADEIRTHRIASHVMESTRYNNYENKELCIVKPYGMESELFKYFCSHLYQIGAFYSCIIQENYKPEIARDILPLCIKTELVTTMNLREWLYFLELRTAKDVHPAMRELTVPLLYEMQGKMPEIFGVIVPYEG